jgi:hypothetical protein
VFDIFIEKVFPPAVEMAPLLAVMTEITLYKDWVPMCYKSEQHDASHPAGLFRK